MQYSEIFEITKKYLAEENFGEALNFLKTIQKTEGSNDEIESLIDQIQISANYLNRDIYASTNLDMDPWFS